MQTDLSGELVEYVNQVAVLVLLGDEKILTKAQHGLKRLERDRGRSLEIGFRATLWL